MNTNNRNAIVLNTGTSEFGPVRNSGSALRALAACAALACASCASMPKCDLGFVVSHDTTLGGADRIRALGPIYERQKTPDGKTFTSIRPFYSSVRDPATKRSVQDLLWPVATFRATEKETDWRVLLAFGHDFDRSDPHSRHRLWILPFVFAGRDAKGEPYFALFPLGGKVNEFLGQDKIVFALFPLYMRTSVHNLNEHNVLWPLVSWANAEGVSRFKILPFYGESWRKDMWSKRFVMWPFWTSVRYDYPGAEGGGFILFPFYGRVSTADQDERWVLPPFFKFARSSRQRELTAPWPFFRHDSGKVNRFWVWPLWGARSEPRVKSGFFLWPLGQWGTADRGGQVASQFQFLPFIFSETVAARSKSPGAGNPTSPAVGTSPATADGTPGVTQGAESGAADSQTPGPADNPEVLSRYFKVWPLASYRREGESARSRAPDLWPLKHTPAVERNWAPLWTLYSNERLGDSREVEALWGLFRHRRDAQGGRKTSVFPLFSCETSGPDGARRSWSALLGLIGCKREDLRKTYRLLYFIRWSTSGSSDGR